MANGGDKKEGQGSDVEELVHVPPGESSNQSLFVEPIVSKRWRDVIGVEPSLFLYMVSSFIRFPAYQALVYEMVCYNEYGTSQICSNSSLTRKDHSVQLGSNHMILASTLTLTIPSLVVSALLGSISDKYSRKLALLVPFVGLVLSDIVTLIVTSIDFKRLSVYWLLLADCVFGCCGGFIAILGTMFAYSAALTTAQRSRSYRMAVLEGTIGAGGTVGYFCSGYLITLLPFRYVFLMVNALNTICFFGIVVFVRETVTTLREVRNDEGSVFTKALNHLKNSVKVAFKAREGVDRLCLLLLLTALAISFTVFSGSSDILFYYMKYKLGWTPVEYGKFSSIVFLLGTIAILVFYPPMRRYCLSDYQLAIFGMISKATGCVMLAFVFSDWFAYTICVVYCLNRFASAALRSLLSQLVAKDELGQIFAFMKCAVVTSFVAGLFGSFAAGTIFSIDVYRKCLIAGFNHTPEQAEMIFFVGLVGFSLGHPSAFLNKRFGVIWLCVIGCSVSCVSYMLLWSAFRQPESYVNKLPLLALYNFVAGHSLSYFYHCSVVVNCRNIEKKHRGKVMGILHIPFGSSPIILSAVVSEKNPGSMFLIMAALGVLAGFFCIISLRHIPRTTAPVRTRPDVRDLTTEAYEYAPSDTGSPANYASEDEAPLAANAAPVARSSIANGIDRQNRPERVESLDSNHPAAQSICSTFISVPKFIIPTVCFMFGLSSVLLLYVNLSSNLNQVHLSGYHLSCLLYFSITTAPTRALMGAYTDCFIGSLARKDMLVLGFGLYAASTVAGAILYREAGMWIFMSACAGVAYGALWSMLPAQLSEMWGTRKFQLLWTSTLTCGVLFAIAVHYLCAQLVKYVHADQSPIMYVLIVQSVLSLACIIISRYPTFK